MSPQKPRALIAVPLPADILDDLRESCEVVVAPSGYFPSRDELMTLAPTVAGVATTVFCRFDAELITRCPDLRVISACGVGLDHIDVALATSRGIVVCNTPGLQDTTVAEMALALLFGLARNLFANDRFVRSGSWIKGQVGLAIDIRGKRLGLLGMGGIGRAMAALGRAVGLDVVYHKRNRDIEAETRGLARYVSRDELFAISDFVSLHVPLNPETRDSVGAREFALMKRGSFLINTARGAIVNEAELIAALQSGHLGGAGLDVMAQEPLPADNPLCALPNVILQPHAGGATHETRRRMEEMAARNMKAVLMNQRPERIVNPQVLGHR